MKTWEKFYIVGLAFFCGLAVHAAFCPTHERWYIQSRYKEACVYIVVDDEHASTGYVTDELGIAEDFQTRVDFPTTVVRVDVGYGRVVPNSRFVPRKFKEPAGK